MTDGIVEFLNAQLAEEAALAQRLADRYVIPEDAYIVEKEPERAGQPFWPIPSAEAAFRNYPDPDIRAGLELVRMYSPARVLAVVAFMRRIVELHTSGVYRTYQCGNRDHIQEWQCERAKEPYTEHRYCEVCGGSECVEVPLLAGIWAGRPGFKDEWRLA